jgi:predicted DNA-binding transcriptional regulator YafY
LKLLQSRGKLSARQLADELEVSECAIYGDINTRSLAGVPVNDEPGRDGGFALINRFRVTLTGFNDEELKCLFILSVPELSTELGLNQNLRNALLKLSAALPEARKGLNEKVRHHIYLDWKWWQQGKESVLHLQLIYHAVLKKFVAIYQVSTIDNRYF